ncbi:MULTISPECIES: hypothetical protein [Cupriavidus]|uniref:Uncharacterized protein n=1 Tax=Cupriavidus taiwanensis (strain DSM 17343 / BCRC 17206 / CCUG 44338 / CIP 107171 / LMG 19424 / R1) TaxID=977880 RepID=B3R3I4_CUPTR|nr:MULTISPECIES: hypothetical protein [Cupriavidus]MEC3766852.1 hypothetical protein [Cupriavidus sp. SS-3]NSX15597.1 hypothetical protein [Cupriavidus taiwanensis]CAQ68865.1 hypothetical protein RALTA_A0898 [Cupriavidus taiwanensis LMG 19424]SOZ15564.1 hypothetical protein CBM2604_A50404 [Cupriavidus taiwanensis]SOZ27808.1 hypothetical protein CBM2609_A60404 [Cupriavidus taiwanensis]
MPEIDLHFTDQELAALERLRQQQGLASLQQAAEWLAKTSIRHAAERMTGKRRAFKLVVPPGKTL